jgi:hypothetical protein
MSMKEKCLIGAGVAMLMLTVVSFVLAAEGDATQEQKQQQPTTRATRPAEPPSGRFNGGDFQEMMKNRLKEELKPSDAEWAVIDPRLTKVMALSNQANLMPMRRMMRGRMGPGGRGGRPGAEANAEEQTEVEKAISALETALGSEKPDAADVKAKLLALRQAREKARQELAKAQQELREVLTVEQEARLVLVGMLD